MDGQICSSFEVRPIDIKKRLYDAHAAEEQYSVSARGVVPIMPGGSVIVQPFWLREHSF